MAGPAGSESHLVVGLDGGIWAHAPQWEFTQDGDDLVESVVGEAVLRVEPNTFAVTEPIPLSQSLRASRWWMHPTAGSVRA